MFAHRLVAKTFDSLAAVPPTPSLNDSDAVRRLLERHTGFTQFRIELPGAVSWWDASSRNGPVVREMALTDAVRTFVQEDRARIIEVIGAAVAEQRAFQFTARLPGKNRLRFREVFGDVKVEAGQVTEIFGIIRDIGQTVEREVLSTSRARLIQSLMEDLPTPLVVLDRDVRILACTASWARCHGLGSQSAATGKALGALVELNRAQSSAILEALGGTTARYEALYHTPGDQRPVKRQCVVMPWVGRHGIGGVMMSIGGEPIFVSRAVANRQLGLRFDAARHGRLSVALRRRCIP